MKLTGLLLFALLGWTGLGAIGIVLSLVRRHRAEAGKHAMWLTSIFIAYLTVLLAVSFFKPQKSVPVGQEQCFQTMCFAVVSTSETPGLVAGDTGRVVRVGIRVTNRGSAAESDSSLRVYLVDAEGRAWDPLAGLSGNRLDVRVAGQSQILSQPMFRVAGDSQSLGLVFTHGDWQFRRLVIGDSDSLGHKRTIVPLN